MDAAEFITDEDGEQSAQATPSVTPANQNHDGRGDLPDNVLSLADCEAAIEQIPRTTGSAVLRHRACELRSCILENGPWPKLVRRAKADHLRRFGLPDLLFRLACQLERERRAGSGPDLLRRARAWFHTAEQCSAGKSEIPDATANALSEWIPSEETPAKRVTATCLSCGKRMRVAPNSRFSTCRECRAASRRGKEAEAIEKKTGALPEGFRRCGLCGNAFHSTRDDARFCSGKCRKRASRRPGVTDKPVFEAATA